MQHYSGVEDNAGKASTGNNFVYKVQFLAMNCIVGIKLVVAHVLA